MHRLAQALMAQVALKDADEESEATRPFQLYRLGVARDDELEIIRKYFKSVENNVRDWLELDFDVFISYRQGARTLKDGTVAMHDRSLAGRIYHAGRKQMSGLTDLA